MAWFTEAIQEMLNELFTYLSCVNNTNLEQKVQIIIYRKHRNNPKKKITLYPTRTSLTNVLIDSLLIPWGQTSQKRKSQEIKQADYDLSITERVGQCGGGEKVDAMRMEMKV